MPHYMIMIHDDDEAFEDSDEAYKAHVGVQHAAFTAKYGAAILDCRLMDPRNASVVRPDGDGGFFVADMVFPEAKEVLGGIYLVAAADKGEALAIARDVQLGWGGRIEVWPITNGG